MRKLVLTMAAFVFLAGCVMAGSIFNTEPFVDAKKDAQGNVILLDTPRNWQDWRELADLDLAAEIAGKKAPGGATWNKKWARQLLAIEKTQENAPKYVTYIIESRRRAGLPELEGYPPSADE